MENESHDTPGIFGVFDGTIMARDGNEPATCQPYPDRRIYATAGTMCTIGHANFGATLYPPSRVQDLAT